MANNSNFEPVFIKQPFPLEKEAKTRMADVCQKGETLFDKISGEQYLVTKKNDVNGIEHFQLVSESSGSVVYLSKFAVDERFTSQKGDVQSFGQRMIVRLSKMF